MKLSLPFFCEYVPLKGYRRVFFGLSILSFLYLLLRKLVECEYPSKSKGVKFPKVVMTENGPSHFATKRLAGCTCSSFTAACAFVGLATVHEYDCCYREVSLRANNVS